MPEPELRDQLVAILRDLGATLQDAVESGQRSARLDAHDLVETLLAIADRLDPPVGG